jgi:hypothetical protein
MDRHPHYMALALFVGSLLLVASAAATLLGLFPPL